MTHHVHTLKMASHHGVCMRNYYKSDGEIEIDVKHIKGLEPIICYIDEGRYQMACCIIHLKKDKKVIAEESLDDIAKLFNFSAEELLKLVKNTKKDS